MHKLALTTCQTLEAPGTTDWQFWNNLVMNKCAEQLQFQTFNEVQSCSECFFSSFLWRAQMFKKRTTVWNNRTPRWPQRPPASYSHHKFIPCERANWAALMMPRLHACWFVLKGCKELHNQYNVRCDQRLNSAPEIQKSGWQNFLRLTFTIYMFIDRTSAGSMDRERCLKKIINPPPLYIIAKCAPVLPHPTKL